MRLGHQDAVSRAVVEALEGRRLLAASLLEIGVAPQGSNPSDFIEVNGTLFFTATDGAHGNELWKSDGTAEGTVMVKDINTGGGSESINESQISQLTVVNGKLFFIAGTWSSRRVWVSDGTAEGTFALTEDSSRTTYDPNYLADANGLLFFIADDGVHGAALWKSDGTVAGTTMVKDFPPLKPWDHSGVYTTEMVGTDRLLYFRASTPSHGEELWASDGTTGGTYEVKDIRAGSYGSGPTSFMVWGDQVLFRAINQVPGTVYSGLWKSDGTAEGTVMVTTTAPRAATPKPISVAMNGALYYVGTVGQDSVLARTDGTAEGTGVVRQLSDSGGSLSTTLVRVGNSIYFRGSSAEAGSELWKTDGSAAGTVMVKDIWGGAIGSAPDKLTNVNGTLFFTASAEGTGVELWKSDGTAEGTVLVKDVQAGGEGCEVESLANVNGMLFFNANDGMHGEELWKSDGTVEGTVMVKDIRPRTVSGGFGYPTAVGDVVYFSADDGYRGLELWKTDGTAAGTVLVKDIEPGRNGSGWDGFAVVNGQVFFVPWTSAYGQELWITDGTEGGTRIVKDITPGTAGSQLRARIAYNGKLLFFISQYDDMASGYKTWLWQSDGTEAGTVMVKDLSVTGSCTSASEIVSIGGVGYFIVASPDGKGLWRTDGTEAGTVLVKTIEAVETTWGRMVAVEEELYFVGDDGEHGRELWKSDGTEAGTVMVKDIWGGSLGSAPDKLTNVNGTVFFTASVEGTGGELWKSDGTPEGTVLVKDIYPGQNGSNPSYLTEVNGVCYFAASDSEHGFEVWKSDGTEAGTVLLKDINPGVGESVANPLFKLGGTLYFGAYDRIHGRELWKSDGTEAGTVMVADVNPGHGSSEPAWWVSLNGKLLFQANDGYAGSEPWVLMPDELGGGSGDDAYLVRMAEEGPYVQVYENADATGKATYTIARETFGQTSSPFVIDLGAGNDTVTLDFSNGLPLPALGASSYAKVIGGDGDDVLVIRGTSRSDDLTVSTRAVSIGDGMFAIDTMNVVLGVAGGQMELGSLETQDSARVSSAGAELRIGTMELRSGTLELNRTRLVVEKGDVGKIEGWIRSARGENGDWSGHGLSSSAAKTEAFTGLAAVLEGEALVVKHTWEGDANSDGIVNADDYLQIDSGYITQAKGWGNGDFNYDGMINADDYFLIDSAYIGQRVTFGVQQLAVWGVQEAIKKDEDMGVMEELVG